MAKDRQTIWDEWGALVNMAPKELEEWLETDASRRVGDRDDGSGSGESTGHRSGRKIVGIKRTKKDDLSDAQWDWMAKTVGYIKRHKAQTPQGDVADSDWRYSLMNWGHDPLKDD